MKKRLLFVTIFLVLLFATATIASANSGVDMIEANETWNGVWGADTEYKYAYLQVDQTGYYDLSVESLNSTGYYSLELYDLEYDYYDYSWYNTSVSLWEEYGEDSAENIYLIAGHLYEIEMQYGYYDYSDYEFYPQAANLKVTFTKNDYQTINMALGTYTNLVIGNGSTQWLVFKTSAAGEYLFETNQLADMGIAVYEKVAGTNEDYLYFGESTNNILHLKANTEYIMQVSDYADFSQIVRFRVSKTKNIKSIDVVQNSVVLADEGYELWEGGRPYFYWSFTDECFYKITYTDLTTETLTHSGLEQKGIGIWDIYYLGELIEQSDGFYFDTGAQPATIVCMNNQSFTTSVYITSYVEWCADLNPVTDYDDMVIEYEDDAWHTYYWRLIPNETNNYEFYSVGWDNVSAYLTIYDEDNNVVERDDGWNLVGGEEYSLKVEYCYEEYCYSDVEFWMEPNRDHVHSITATKVNKATLTENGSIDRVCSSCGYVGSSTVIARPTTFTLSTVNYTYNGVVKTPGVTVKDANGKTLVKGTDYTVTYPSGRKALGTYKVTITMKGNYSGTKTLTFNIKLGTPNVTVANATNGVKVSWNKIAGAKNYTVYRSVYTNGAWSGWKAIKTGVTGTSYTDTSLKSNANVKYTVRAFNGSHSSTYKASSSIKFLAAPTVTVSNAANGVKISWNAIAGAKNYKVYKSVYTNGAWSSWKAIKTGVTGTTYTDTSVKSNDNVKYTVRAFNGNFSSTYKSSSSIKFLATPTVKATNAAKGVTVSWNKITGAKTYTVYRSVYSGGKWSGWTEIKTGVTGTSYTDTTVKSGATVRYTVKAINSNFRSNVKTGNTTKFLAQPAVKVAKATNGIKTSWGKITGASGYIVYRRTYTNGKWSGWTAVKTTTAVSFTDTTAKKGVTYQYTVRAYSGDYRSSYTNSSSIKR